MTRIDRSVGAVRIRVWDPLVRGFHWAVVALVVITFLSEDARALHEGSGYVVIGLVLARLAWGVVGTRHARFADFLAGPGTVLAYLRALRHGGARRYLGHNPAGGAMIVALLLTLLATALSGWLSETDAYFGVMWVSDFHRVAADVLLGLIGLHLAGVAVSSLLHRENLVAAMITGRKRAAPAAPGDQEGRKRSLDGAFV
jgi:cytochrome b